MGDLSKLQQLAVDNYAEGDFLAYEWKTNEDVQQAEDNGGLGDTLFLFIIRELGDAGEDAEEGARMLRRAAEQLEELASKIEAEVPDEDDDPNYDDQGNLKAGVDHETGA